MVIFPFPDHESSSFVRPSHFFNLKGVHVCRFKGIPPSLPSCHASFLFLGCPVLAGRPGGHCVLSEAIPRFFPPRSSCSSDPDARSGRGPTHPVLPSQRAGAGRERAGQGPPRVSKPDYPDECTPSWSPSCPASTRNNPCGLVVILFSHPSRPYGPLHAA